MRRFLVALGLALGLVCPAGAGPNDAEARYQALVAQAKAGAAPVDWQALRFAYADRPNFMAFDRGLNPTRLKMIEARRTANFPDLLENAKAVIEQDYVDGQAHFWAGTALLAQNRRGAARAGHRRRDLQIDPDRRRPDPRHRLHRHLGARRV